MVISLFLSVCLLDKDTKLVRLLLQFCVASRKDNKGSITSKVAFENIIRVHMNVILSLLCFKRWIKIERSCTHEWCFRTQPNYWQPRKTEKRHAPIQKFYLSYVLCGLCVVRCSLCVVVTCFVHVHISRLFFTCVLQVLLRIFWTSRHSVY